MQKRFITHIPKVNANAEWSPVGGGKIVVGIALLANGAFTIVEGVVCSVALFTAVVFVPVFLGAGLPYSSHGLYGFLLINLMQLLVKHKNMDCQEEDQCDGNHTV